MRIQFLVEHLLGFIHPIDPRKWPLVVRRLRAAQGWAPPMLLIATAMTLMFASQGFGLFGGHIVVKLFNFLALATWFVVGVAASFAAVVDGSRNLRRLGLFGLSRPRWWFELSRLAWMAFLFLALSAPILHFAGGFDIAALSSVAIYVFVTLYAAFMTSGTTAYLLSIFTRRRRSGRAFECVEYFYWLCGILFWAVMVVVWLPARLGWAEPMTAVLCMIAASLLAIVVIRLASRRRQLVDGRDAA
jgi:hypothetical protein